MLQEGEFSIVFWEQVLPVQTGFIARGSASWSASPAHLWSWGDAASEGKVALQRQIQISYRAVSAHPLGEGMEGMVKGSGGSPRRFPMSYLVLPAGLASVHLPKRGLWVPPPEAAQWGHV